MLVGDEPVRLSRFQAYVIALIFGHGEEGISRPRLVEMLWGHPDGPPQRHRLSQLLYGIRQKVGGRAIVKDDGFLMSNLPSQSVDLERVNDLFACHEYEEIKRIVSRGLFARLERVPTNDFTRWTESCVKRFRQSTADNLSHACHEAGGRSDWKALGRAVSVANEICPPREDFLRYSIRHLVTTGQGSQVAREVAAFETRWTRVNLEPWSPHRTTVDLLEDTSKLLEKRVRSARDEQRLPIVGRESELTLLHDSLATPTRGLTLLTILGEAGVGKTRLCEEALDRLRPRGPTSLCGTGGGV